MVRLPKRNKIVTKIRGAMSFLEERTWYPFKTPEYYQIVCLILSILFPLITHNRLKIFFVTLILVLDWYDGAAARKFKKLTSNGWLSDVVVDRISEGFIFISMLQTPLGKILFLAYLANILLSYHSYVSKKHIILPLRATYLVYLIYIVINSAFSFY